MRVYSDMCGSLWQTSRCATINRRMMIPPRTAAAAFDPRRSLEKLVASQNNLRPRELSKAITTTRGRGFGAYVDDVDDAVCLVIMKGAEDDHRKTVAILNKAGVGSYAIQAVKTVCQGLKADEPCIIPLYKVNDAEWCHDPDGTQKA